MAWSNSKIFSAFITDALNRTIAYDLNADTFKVALFDNTITPSQTVAQASTSYLAGVWGSGHVFDAAGWPQVGRNLTLGTTSSTFSSNVFTFDDTTDTVSANATTTLTNAYGCLIYDDTTASDAGVCFNYFGGANSVTSGTFTVVWNASGILALTL